MGSAIKGAAGVVGMALGAVVAGAAAPPIAAPSCAAAQRITGLRSYCACTTPERLGGAPAGRLALAARWLRRVGSARRPLCASKSEVVNKATNAIAQINLPVRIADILFSAKETLAAVRGSPIKIGRLGREFQSSRDCWQKSVSARDADFSKSPRALIHKAASEIWDCAACPLCQFGAVVAADQILWRRLPAAQARKQDAPATNAIFSSPSEPPATLR
jgi:hypothetical protein